MYRSIVRALLGVSIVASQLALAEPAGATLWRNYGSRGFANPLYLSVGEFEGNPALLTTYAPFYSWMYDFFLIPDGAPGFNHIENVGMTPPHYRFHLAIGVQGNNMKNGTPLIGWEPNDMNQDWRFDYAFPDQNGALCYILYNGNSPSNHVYVMGVAGGNMVNDTALILWDYLADPVFHPDQFWCAYKFGPNGTIVPE